MMRSLTKIAISLACSVLFVNGFAWAGTPPAAQTAQDVVQQRTPTGSRPISGRIIKDDFSGMTIQSGGAEETVKSSEIVNFTYGELVNANSGISDVVIALDLDDTATANDILAELIALLPSGDSARARANLIRQHIAYYSALSQMKEGKYQQAADGFRQLCNNVKNNAHYFDARLNEARCIELSKGAIEGQNQYALLAQNDFDGKAKEANLASRASAEDEAARAKGQANLAVLRLKIEKAVQGTDKNLVNSLETDLNRWGADNTQLRNIPAIRAEAERIRGLILLYQKKYEQLLPILARNIADRLEANDRDALVELYFQESEAYYGLAEAENDQTKKNDLRRQALVDYLRVILVYSPSPPTLAKSRYQAGLLFEALQDPSWKSRAIAQFTAAIDLKINPWSGLANTALIRVRQAQEK